MQMKRYISLFLLVFGFHLMRPQTTATDGSVEFENSKLSRIFGKHWAKQLLAADLLFSI